MLRKALGTTRLLRVMPNTPPCVGRDAPEQLCTLTEAERTCPGMSAALGRWLWVPEELMEAVVVSGSGPAYGYLFIEALADAG